MASGRLKLLPCGHVGEAIIGHYYRCPICDVVKVQGKVRVDEDFGSEEDTPTALPGPDDHQCPACGSWNTADFTNVWVPSMDPEWHCWTCGHVFKP